MRLSPVTWLFITLAALESAWPIVVFVDGARTLLLGTTSQLIPPGTPPSWNALLGLTAQPFFYALRWLGTAAIVEVLIRIWREVAALRQQGRQ